MPNNTAVIENHDRLWMSHVLGVPRGSFSFAPRASPHSGNPLAVWSNARNLDQNLTQVWQNPIKIWSKPDQNLAQNPGTATMY